MIFGQRLTFGDAVRRGAEKRPQARFAHLSSINGGTDAIGAAADAIGYLNQLINTYDYGPLQKRWPVLGRRVKHPLRKEIALVQSIVHDLNDRYGWPRDAIAAFVDGLDVALLSTGAVDEVPVTRARVRRPARATRAARR